MIDYKSILNGQIDKLNTVGSGDDFNVWQSHTLNILRRVFGEDSPQVKQLESIKYWASSPPIISSKRPRLDSYEPPRYVPKNNIEYCVQQSHKLLTAFIEELEALGLPNLRAPSNNGGININVSQNQSIHLSVVLNTLRDELTGPQFQEIEDVLKSDSKPEEKKKTVLEKLTSFGGDVASNVLASLLTNPQVFQAFM